MPIDFSAARSPKGFVHSGIKIVPRLSDLFKALPLLLTGDTDLKNSQNLPLSLCGRKRCAKKKKKKILANEGMKYESIPLLLYLPTSACSSQK